MSALAAFSADGFWRRVGAMLLKEFLQLRRDRVTFATMISIPLLQLTLFGYAINTTPRYLPTAVLLQESSDVGRSDPRRVAEHQVLQGHASIAR
jgi:ABC-2 type transport system permease protein